MDASVSTYDHEGSSATWVLKRYVAILGIDSLDKARQYVRAAEAEATASEIYGSCFGKHPAVPVQKYSDIGALDSDYGGEDSESYDSSDLDDDMPYELWRERARAKVDARMAPMRVEVPRPVLLRESRRTTLMEALPSMLQGGARPEAPVDIDETDEYVSKLLQLADACHDFRGIKVTADKDVLHVLETSVLGVGVHVLQPKLTLADIADKGTFIAAVTECEDFKFLLPDGSVRTVPNDMLRDRNLEAAILPFSAGRSVGKKIGKLLNDELRTVDVFFRKTDHGRKLMVLDHVEKLRNVMKDFFGDPFERGGRAPRFMVDQDMCPWLPDEASHRHLFAWMKGFGHLVVAIDEHFKGVQPLSDIGFDFVYCDATVYDGARIERLNDTVRFSPHATGRVFHRNSVANVEFLEHVDPRAKRDSYAYLVTTTDPSRNPFAPGFAGTSIRSIVRDGTITNRVPRAREDNSGKTMRDDAEDLIESGVDVAVPTARKTAGDWGQVEHCKKNGIAFVTSDRLTALYAAYRDVPVLLVKHSDAGTSYVQYSFCMCGSSAARRGLTTPAPPLQSGGLSRASLAMTAALSAVVVACACVPR